MKLVTSAQMKSIDSRTIREYKTPGIELMEKAGLGTAEACRRYLSDCAGKRVLIVCGRGNNGGDGLVAARYLAKWKARVQILLLGKKDQLTGDAKTNLNRAVKHRLAIRQATKADNLPDMLPADLIVDAIFGTGFEGEVRGLEKSAIEKINRSGIPVVAVDIPSGLNADTGKFDPVCVRAAVTVTMGLPKMGQFFFPGKDFCGEVKVVDIGLAPNAVETEKLELELISAEEVKNYIPLRPGNIHKGGAGRIFMLAGSTGLTGAACLACESALLAGAGIVVLGVPESLNQIFEAKLTEVITKPLPDVGKKGALALRGLGEIKNHLEWADCIAIGPGLGQNYQTVELIQRLVSMRINRPLVLDADGINAFAKKPELLKDLPFPVILTPHPGELSRLIGVPIPEIEKKRVEIAKKTAREFNLVLVLKGAPTVVADPEGAVFVNSTGNSGLAKAGSGDVLTGIISGLLAQKVKLEKGEILSRQVLESALAGVYLHGLAADLNKTARTTYSMLASDIMRSLPDAFVTIAG